ncbi:GIY-YIG nuclease family protein [Streptomyces sp. NEAU-174]|uniref:GIY-YIG nuclease family protein n=1 Tax=Streptomyces sp. NEAU-174 TaxID=3458254 RepID=UPI004044D1AF
MFRTSDGGPIQMYEDPYDPIVSYSSPMAGWLYARHPKIPDYWTAVAEEPTRDRAEETETGQGRRSKKTNRKARVSDDSVRTALYRIRNADGELLYVGISAKPPQRWGQHAADKDWWPEVAGLSIEWFDSKTEALAMEARAIRTERPRHNIQHNGTDVPPKV